jgi:hypothetical protein
MDYRRQLFQIESWSPRLANKIWRFKKLLESPFVLALGFKIRHLAHSDVEVYIPSSIQNKNSRGAIQASVLLAGAEFASQSLWLRHIKIESESMFLLGIKADFQHDCRQGVSLKAELLEEEREAILRKLHNGQKVTHEMVISITDLKNQNLGHINCIWSFELISTLALKGGKDVSQT